MSQDNIYAKFDDNVVAAHAPVDARVRFLQKTYSLVAAAVCAFVATLFLSKPGMPLHGVAMWFAFSPIITIILYFAGFIIVHAVSTKPIGLPLFFAFASFWGLISAPLILGVAGMTNGPTYIGQAALITAFLFTGLTAYVFKSGKDFGFLGGFIWVALFGLFGVAIAAWIFGFSIGIWFSYAGAGLMCMFILYDTSNILNRFPANAHVSAALNLFWDIIMLFKHLLLIIVSFAGND